MQNYVSMAVNSIVDNYPQNNIAEENNFHRCMMEREQACKRARQCGSFVTVFIGKDHKQHYKAACDLTQEDLEVFEQLQN